MSDTDKIIKYAKLIERMAFGAFMDTEDRDALASEIVAERELEIQERITPSVGANFEVELAV
jgi:hypothetical protein